jgi:hypothetical protein
MQTTETTILVPFGKVGGFEEVRARPTGEPRLYELTEHAFVHLIPGDVVEVDEFGVTVDVRSYRAAGLVEFFFEEGLGTDMVDRFVDEVRLTYADTSTRVESSVSCLVAHASAGVMKDVVELAMRSGADWGRLVRRPDKTTPVDIWNLDRGAE